MNDHLSFCLFEMWVFRFFNLIIKIGKPGFCLILGIIFWIMVGKMEQTMCTLPIDSSSFFNGELLGIINKGKHLFALLSNTSSV